MTIRSLFLSASLLLALAAPAAAQWTQVGTGIENKELKGILIDDGVMLACTADSGVYRSTDAGATWATSNNGLTNLYVPSLRKVGTTIIAASFDGVFLSTDAGATWSSSKNGISFALISCVAADSSGNLYAGSSGAGVFKSTNGGANWAAVNTGLRNPTLISLNFVAGKLIAGTMDGPDNSTDGGAHWVGPTASPSSYYVFHVMDQGGVLYAGTNGGVYHSTNAGDTWGRPYNDVPNATVTGIVSDGTHLFASTLTDGVYTANDNSQPWTDVSDGLPVKDIRGLSLRDGYVYAATWGKGVWRRPVSEMATGVGEISSLPAAFSLGQNYPNPFNPSTTIGFALPSQQQVRLSVFDVLGREVARLVDGVQSAGNHAVTFDAVDLPSGVYMYRLSAGAAVQLGRMVLAR